MANIKDMLKKETIWREILFQSIEKNQYNFKQIDLAKKFGFSLSTVFNALKVPREIKAIEVSGRGFKLKSVEKLLYLWATQRKFKKDIIYQTFVSDPVEKIESAMPEDIIWAGFSAYKFKYGQAPADYSQIFVYSDNLEEIKKRFPLKKGPSNLFVLKQDEYLKKYGQFGTMGQIFVDIWNSDEWYAQEFIKQLKEKIKI